MKEPADKTVGAPSPSVDVITDRSISVVAACYNEFDNIPTMHDRLTATLATITTSYEIIFVENGSTDESQSLLIRLAQQDPRVHVIIMSRNFGSQGAFSSGLEYATGDAVILLDGDLQDPPELIPQFVARWLEGNEVVYGERIKRRAPLVLRFAYKAFYRLFTRLSYVKIPVDAGDFGLMDRRVVDVLNAMPEKNRFIRGLRAWSGFRQSAVPYVRQERHAGNSTNSIVDLFRWASTGLVSFSYAPLELIAWLSMFVTAAASIVALVYVGMFVAYRSAPPGFLTLLLATLFLGAIQLLSLSIIAEYLAKMFEEIKARPKFIVDRVVHHNPAAVEGRAHPGAPGSEPDASAA